MNINPDCSHFVDDSVGKETQNFSNTVVEKMRAETQTVLILLILGKHRNTIFLI